MSFTGWDGRRTVKTGYPVSNDKSGKLTKQLVTRLEAEAREIRAGWRPAPTTADRYRNRPVMELVQEYLDWGTAQGGRGGRPWGAGHARNRKSRLIRMVTMMNLSVMRDLYGALPRAEKILREHLNAGCAGKTCQSLAEAIRSFCGWAKDRGYLQKDPLEALAPFDITPRTQRRALTVDEIQRLLAVSSEGNRLLYETAICSGLRANELRMLTPGHIDDEGCGLRLDPAWTKNRKEGFQPLPRELVNRLRSFAADRRAAALYHKADTCYRGGAKRHERPADPLLFVPSGPAETLRRDLEKAGIMKHAPSGKVDFHALRVAYDTLILEAGAGVKEAQTLMRHSTPSLTLNTYGRTREHRLAELAERVGEQVLFRCAPVHETADKSVAKIAAGAETYCPVMGYNVGEAGLEPARSCDHRILNPVRLPFRHSPVSCSLPVPRDVALQFLVAL